MRISMSYVSLLDTMLTEGRHRDTLMQARLDLHANMLARLCRHPNQSRAGGRYQPAATDDQDASRWSSISRRKGVAHGAHPAGFARRL